VWRFRGDGRTLTDGRIGIKVAHTLYTHKSSEPRRHRLISAEWKMYPVLVEHFTRSGMVVLQEWTTHQGRPDLVGVRIDWGAAERRRALGLESSLSDPTMLRAWRALAAPAQTMDEWARRLSVLPRTLKEPARRLEAAGFVSGGAAGFSRRVELPRIVRELICCEAKIDDWRAGVRQAHCHRFYAHRSYVALARVPSTVDGDVLAARRLGLLAVDEAGVTVRRHAPALTPKPSLVLEKLEEALWLRVVSPDLAGGRIRAMPGSGATGSASGRRSP